MRQAARTDQLIKRASRNVKQLRRFIGFEQGFVKEIREAALMSFFPSQI